MGIRVPRRDDDAVLFRQRFGFEHGEHRRGAALRQRSQGENRKTTTPVGTFKANAWGLDDMHGNLGQWCLDGINGYRKEAVIDPINPPGHPVLRGGSWAEDSVKCRSAKRWRDPVATKKDKIGFRVVLIEQ